MSKYFNILTILIVMLFSVKTFALESTDNLKTQIIKVYSRNILVLNRGTEDGIFRNDHIKLTTGEGFIARGICIKQTMMTSHWKIYRVTRPELVSKDTLYTMRSINQSQIPQSYSSYTTVDFSKYLNDVTDHNIDKMMALQQKRLLKFDLPKHIEEAKPTVPPKRRTVVDKFLANNFDKEKLKADTDQLYMNLYASPISWQTRGNQVQTNYGLSLYNHGDKYGFALNADLSQAKHTDTVSETSYKSSSNHFDGQFQINRAAENISIFSYYSYDTETIGETSYPIAYHQIGLAGVKLHAQKDRDLNNFFDISYIPVFENISYDAADGSGAIDRQGLRHRVEFKYHKEVNDKLITQNSFSVAPFYNSETAEMDYSDTNATLKSLWSYKINQYLFWDFELEYAKDQLRGETYSVTPDNTKNTFRLRYQMPI